MKQRDVLSTRQYPKTADSLFAVLDPDNAVDLLAVWLYAARYDRAALWSLTYEGLRSESEPA